MLLTELILGLKTLITIIPVQPQKSGNPNKSNNSDNPNSIQTTLITGVIVTTLSSRMALTSITMVLTQETLLTMQ